LQIVLDRIYGDIRAFTLRPAELLIKNGLR